MSNTKKIALMSTLVLLLALTAVVNFVLAGTRSDVAASADASADFFSIHRSERLSTRSEEFVQLDSIISAYAADSAEYSEAIAAKQKLVSIMENELIIETMVKALGFSDAAVVIGSDSDNINIFVHSAELTSDNAVQIFSVLEEEMGVRDGNIIIMPIYAEA